MFFFSINPSYVFFLHMRPIFKETFSTKTFTFESGLIDFAITDSYLIIFFEIPPVLRDIMLKFWDIK